MLETEQKIEFNENNLWIPPIVQLKINRIHLFFSNVFWIDPADLTDLMNNARQQLNDEQSHTFY